MGQPVGKPIDDFKKPILPNFLSLQGHSVVVESISPSHLPILYKALNGFIIDRIKTLFLFTKIFK